MTLLPLKKFNMLVENRYKMLPFIMRLVGKV
jgi:hypothetical protein